MKFFSSIYHISVYHILAICFLIISAISGYADTKDVSKQMQALQNNVNLAKTGAQKHDALFALGRFSRVTGDIESAAKHFRAAAFAEPGVCDANALSMSILCNIAQGDWDKAEADCAIILGAAGIEDEYTLKTRKLAYFIESFKNGDNPLNNELYSFNTLNTVNAENNLNALSLLFPGRDSFSLVPMEQTPPQIAWPNSG